jgi:hypothetical protein
VAGDEATAADDVIGRGSRRPARSGPRWRPPRIGLILAAAGLVAGLGAGYAAGVRQGGKAAAPPAPPVTGAAPLSQAGLTCSTQSGGELQLGVDVANESAAAVTLRKVTVVLPIGGLREVSQAWGPCGELPAATVAPANVVPAGGSTWFTVTFQVLVSCPQPLPVQFILRYQRSSQAEVTDLPGFPDLGQVPYGQCPVAFPPAGSLTG